MALNYIWIGFFVLGFFIALIKLIFLGDTQIFPAMFQEIHENAKTGFEISLYLSGVMALWLGIMKVGERGGFIEILSRFTYPFFSRLFPEVPRGHPAMGSIIMNFSANLLNLDNAATPLGLKAMHSLQEINPEPKKASNAQIMFLVLNTSGLTLIPVNIMVYRAQMGAENPADVFVPLLIATFCSTVAGLLAVAYFQKIKISDPYLFLPILTLAGIIGAIIYWVSASPQQQVEEISTLAGNLILVSIIVTFIIMAAWKRINVYDAFIDGAKDGFKTAIKIIPFLIAILVAVGVFRVSGGMDYLVSGFRWFFGLLGLDTSFVQGLPTAFMKPLSGSGARGMMLEAMDQHGADSFTGRLVSILQGSTETTFYVLAVYFGAVKIRQTRHALPCGLIADGAGIIAAIAITYLFFF